MKEHEFYPMVNRTIKSIIAVVDKQKYSFGILRMLATYNNPNYLFTREEETDPVYMSLFNELNRQYARWNKGASNDKEI